MRAGPAVSAGGPDQCQDRLNCTPQTELTRQEGLPWRASARPGWRRLTRPKGTAAVTHGLGSADADSPGHRWRLRGSVAAAQEEQLAGMSRQGRRIIPERTIPARPRSSHRQPARPRSLSSCSRPTPIHNVRSAPSPKLASGSSKPHRTAATRRRRRRVSYGLRSAKPLAPRMPARDPAGGRALGARPLQLTAAGDRTTIMTTVT
jgi:hypothetical protein